MPTQRIEFPGAHGDTLSARLELPHERPVAYAVFAHCFTCSKNIKAAVNITRALAKRGIGVLRFDFTGLGESEGDFADTNFSSNVEDLVAAADYLTDRFEAPALMVGHSLGGAAAIVAASRLDSVRAVATLGAPADPAHIVHHFDDERATIEREGEAEVRLGGRPFTVRRHLLEDVSRQNLTELLPDLDRALLVMHAPLDPTVGIDNAKVIYDAAKHPKSFISLDDADHLISKEEDSRYAGLVLAAWARRYIGAPAEEDESEATHGEERLVVVQTERDRFRTEISARQHSLLADEPEDHGGTDQGPTPYELLSAGLGACTSITLRMYADRKEWPLEKVIVRLDHEKCHAKDCPEADLRYEHQGKIDHIERRIELIGDLDEEQRTRLMEIADACPVHRTLEAGIFVTTTAETSETAG